jgi:hypothetical protein
MVLMAVDDLRRQFHSREEQNGKISKAPCFHLRYLLPGGLEFTCLRLANKSFPFLLFWFSFLMSLAVGSKQDIPYLKVKQESTPHIEYILIGSLPL